MLDIWIVIFYFIAVMVMALSGKKIKDQNSEDYFLAGRRLKWYSVAISTIATNIQGYQFLGMMGSAYLFGLAQANLEINAMQGLLMAAFIFVPLYLRERIITITQLINRKLGRKLGLFYAVANISLFSTIGLGSALFWGAYAADAVFTEYLLFIGNDPLIRGIILIVFLGVFSAIYTYYGGLSAVVRTDIIQFAILILGGTILLWKSISAIGGWEQLYAQKESLMHLHLPADHGTLPWIAIGGMFLLNINYWCGNQVVMQRSLAAKNLKEAQLGLLAGGFIKYFMAILIIIPGIALAILLEANPLSDPDKAFPYLVDTFLSSGLKGIILCALFASLMSTIDSLFNSLSTLWAIDIYKGYLNPNANDLEIVKTGRKTILVTLITGVLTASLLMYLKYADTSSAFTHTLNELRYYVNCGIVVLICTAAFFLIKKQWYVLLAFLGTVPMQLLLKYLYPEMNYFVRAMWVILFGFLVVAFSTVWTENRWKDKDILVAADNQIKWLGWSMLASLILLHICFH